MSGIRNTCRLVADYLTVLAVYAHGALAYARALIHQSRDRGRQP